jgi:hypothetical protein
MESVLDALALTEELGVGDHLDPVREIRALQPQDPPQPIRGPGGDGGLLDHDDGT